MESKEQEKDDAKWNEKEQDGGKWGEREKDGGKWHEKDGGKRHRKEKGDGKWNEKEKYGAKWNEKGTIGGMWNEKRSGNWGEKSGCKRNAPKRRRQVGRNTKRRRHVGRKRRRQAVRKDGGKWGEKIADIAGKRDGKSAGITGMRIDRYGAYSPKVNSIPMLS